MERLRRAVLAIAIFALVSGAAPAPALGAQAVGTILSGLARPMDLAAAPNGDLYFTQSPTPTELILSRLRRGASAAEPVLTMPDYNGVVPAAYQGENAIQSISFDRTGHVYFIQRTTADPSGQRGRSAVVRLDPRTGATAELWGADAEPMPSSQHPIAAGQWATVLDVTPDGTVYFAGSQFDQSLGHAVAVVYRLAPDAAGPTLLARFVESTSGFLDVNAIVADSHGRVYVIVANLARLDPSGAVRNSSAVYEVGTPGTPRLITALPTNSASGVFQVYLHLGVDARGDLYVHEQSRSGAGVFGCAETTRHTILRFDRHAGAGTVVSDTSYPGFEASWLPTSAVFRVSATGDVFLFSAHVVPRCATPPGPVLFDELKVIEAPAAHRRGLSDQVAVYADALTSETQWAMPLTFALDRGGGLYVASRVHGTIVRLRPQGAEVGQREVTIVSSLPLTWQPISRAVSNAIQMAIADRGGEIRGIRIRYRSLDDGAPTNGWPGEVANAQAAAADPAVVAYVGPWNSGAAKRSIPLLCTAGLAMISSSNTYTGLTKAAPIDLPGEPDIYYPGCARNYSRVVPTDAVGGEVAAARVQGLGGAGVYVITTALDTFANRQSSFGFTSEAGRIGLPIVGTETVAGNATDFAALGERVRTSGANFVFLACGQDIDNCGFIVRDLRAAAPAVRIMTTDGIAFNPGFIAQAGPAAEGTLAVREFLAPADYSILAAAWYARYQRIYGPVVGDDFNDAIYAYDATNAVLRAIATAAHAPSRDAIRRALMATSNFPGLLGTWSLDRDGDTTSSRLSTAAVIGGRWSYTGAASLP